MLALNYKGWNELELGRIIASDPANSYFQICIWDVRINLYYLLFWFECVVSPINLGCFLHLLVTLFWKTMDPLGSEWILSRWYLRMELEVLKCSPSSCLHLLPDCALKCFLKCYVILLQPFLHHCDELWPILNCGPKQTLAPHKLLLSNVWLKYQ